MVVWQRMVASPSLPVMIVSVGKPAWLIRTSAPFNGAALSSSTTIGILALDKLCASKRVPARSKQDTSTHHPAISLSSNPDLRFQDPPILSTSGLGRPAHRAAIRKQYPLQQQTKAHSCSYLTIARSSAAIALITNSSSVDR